MHDTNFSTNPKVVHRFRHEICMSLECSPLLSRNACFHKVFGHSHHRQVRRSFHTKNFAPQTCSCWPTRGPCWRQLQAVPKPVGHGHIVDVPVTSSTRRPARLSTSFCWSARCCLHIFVSRVQEHACERCENCRREQRHSRAKCERRRAIADIIDASPLVCWARASERSVEQKVDVPGSRRKPSLGGRRFFPLTSNVTSLSSQLVLCVARDVLACDFVRICGRLLGPWEIEGCAAAEWVL